MNRKLENAAVGLAILVTLAGIVALNVTLLQRWPAYTLIGFAVITAIAILLSTLRDYRILRLLGTAGYDNSQAGTSRTFSGIYRPHWEIGHIQVPTARRRLWLFPLFESWNPHFTDEFPHELEEDSPNYIVTFVGTPSERGQFGHMGSMDRNISVERFLSIEELPRKAV